MKEKVKERLDEIFGIVFDGVAEEIAEHLESTITRFTDIKAIAENNIKADPNGLLTKPWVEVKRICDEYLEKTDLHEEEQ